jgi:soluble lytic murein transglycosylase-like protein
MHLKFLQSSSALSVFAVILIALVCEVAAMAQGQATAVEPSAPTQAISTDVDPAPNSAPRKTAELGAKASTQEPKSNDSAAKSASDYQKTLNDLASLYEREVQKLEPQNNQAKELYRDGLIARIEMEKSDKDLAEARAKVEEARNQIATANKPAPVIPAVSPDFTAINAAWSTGNNRVDMLVRYYGKTYGVDPYLIYCLMSQESKFSTVAMSPKGAQGLMQLMPGTAARYGVTNPYDIAQSIMGGTRYLKDLLQMFNGRIDLALAGYNAGENAVIKHGYTVPPYQETRNYVRLIIARYGKNQTSMTSAPAL